MSEPKPDAARMSEDEPEVEGHEARDARHASAEGDEETPEVEGMGFRSDAVRGDAVRSEAVRNESVRDQ